MTEGVGSDWDEDFLSAAVDIVNKNYSKADLVRDTDDGSIHNLHNRDLVSTGQIQTEGDLHIGILRASRLDIVPHGHGVVVLVNIVLLEDAATTLASVVPNNADWVTSEMKRDTTNNKLWHILLTKQDAGLMALAGEDTTAVIWTVAAVDAAIAELQTTIDKNANQLTNEDIAALEELVTTLTLIQDNKVNDYVGVQDTIDTITGKIEEAEEGAAEALIEAKNGQWEIPWWR